MTRMAVLALMTLALGCGSSEPTTRREDPTRPTARTADAPRYDATLHDGVQFWKPGLPLFLADLTGVSSHEPWGRWTDGPVAVVRFAEPLPRRFTLIVTAASYGPNIGQPVEFVAGAVTRTVTFDTELGAGTPDVRRLGFELERPGDRIEIRPPHPTRPSNGDSRALGLALIRLQVEPS